MSQDWIKNNGTIPVAGNTRVDVQLNDDGNPACDCPAEYWEWPLDEGITHWRVSDGWQINSGEMPVPDTFVIDVEYRDGTTDYNFRAADFDWNFNNVGWDITAWKMAEKTNKESEVVTTGTNDVLVSVNPKESIGKAKLPLHLWSPLASAYGSLGLYNGGKYGFGNYKATPILASIYIAATKRHLSAWEEGQECDEDDGVPHLAAILANIAILLESRAVGTLIDDRQIQGGYLKEVKMLTEIAQNIQELHKDKIVKHYTIKDNG